MNLSAKLPNFQDNFHAGIGYFNSQAGYDLLVKVKPDNPGIVWIGGTNLYRSLDGGNTYEWVGGYHPRQYHVSESASGSACSILFPGHPNSLIAGHDGGLSLAANGLESPQSWKSLNNGYLTAQFFAVAIDPLAGGDSLVIGGMQDNGSWGTRTVNPNTPWFNLLGGDGGFPAIAPGGDTYYASQQQGTVVRFSISNGQTVQSNVTPAAAKNFLFVAPYLLDPNDPEVMYLAAGNEVWRNSDLSDIPAGNKDSTNINWSALSNSAEANASITAVAATKRPINRLYFGATDKQNITVIKRLDSADQNPAGEDITPPGVTPGSTPSCICLNPDNPSEILITFSNYNVPSIWYTDDDGAHWTDVEGNLGGADGPSVRWAAAATAHPGTVYFVGTSIGLFSTESLSGPGTVWVQEGKDVIGNVVVSMIAARSEDGFIVAGTHGRGVYSAGLSNAGQLVGDQNPGPPRLMELENGYPNPFNSETVIAYRVAERSDVELSIVDANGRTVRNLDAGEKMPGSYSVRWNGEDGDGLQAASGIYLIKMEIEDHPCKSAVKKIVLLR